MDMAGMKYLLTYLQSLEERMEARHAELKEYADHADRFDFSVTKVTSIASALNNLMMEQRAVCFTLNSIGYYVVYNDKVHAEKIICTATGEEVTPCRNN